MRSIKQEFMENDQNSKPIVNQLIRTGFSKFDLHSQNGTFYLNKNSEKNTSNYL